MLTVKANTKTFKNKQDKNHWNKKQHLDKLAANVSDFFSLLVNRQRAVAVDVEQVLADQVLVVDESRATDHLRQRLTVSRFLTSVRL